WKNSSFNEGGNVAVTGPKVNTRITRSSEADMPPAGGSRNGTDARHRCIGWVQERLCGHCDDLRGRHSTRYQKSAMTAGCPVRQPAHGGFCFNGFTRTVGIGLDRIRSGPYLSVVTCKRVPGGFAPDTLRFSVFHAVFRGWENQSWGWRCSKVQDE